MLKFIRNISIMLSLIILAFGAGGIASLQVMDRSIEDTKIEVYKLTKEITLNEILLSCMTKNIAMLNGVPIACAVVFPKTDKPTKKSPEDPQQNYQSV
jgi:hypothetical protein